MKTAVKNQRLNKVTKYAGRVLLGLGGILLVGATGMQLSRNLFESPAYNVVDSDGNFEVRRYEQRLVAETTAQGPNRSAATSEGFGRLANYIFGGNEKGDGQSKKIAMTSPVEATPADSSRGGEKISMTTPVEATEQEPNQWVVAFTMPSEMRLEDMPKPKDERVTLRMRGSEDVAVLRFRGLAAEATTEERKRELLARVKRRGYEPTGPVTVAVYDPPHWVLPPFRRNEVIVPVKRI